MNHPFLDKALAWRSRIKWTIYTFLLINFAYYVWEDWTVARHSLRAGGTLFEWTAVFANTIDLSAWFALLFLFELETHAIPDEKFTPLLERVLPAARLVFYVLLGHTIYAYSLNLVNLERTTQIVPEVTNLCEVADQDRSFTSNMQYTTIDAENCSELSGATTFYSLGVDTVLTDATGLRIEKELGWVDLVEALAWLMIVFSIELGVRLQNRDIATGAWIRWSGAAKVVLYGTLVLCAAYWAVRGLWLYVWDEFVWIGGFFVIELNVLEWRDDLLEEKSET